MLALVSLAIIGYILYLLFIKGMAWGIIIFCAGIYGIRLGLLTLIPESQKTIMTFASYDVSYAGFFATIITILGLAYFAKD
jgi:hypothetical protein